ncbi:hypothetical protein E4U24_000660, partial [Claviceps purpurea]
PSREVVSVPTTAFPLTVLDFPQALCMRLQSTSLLGIYHRRELITSFTNNGRRTASSFSILPGPESVRGMMDLHPGQNTRFDPRL